jgi:hypothetical protein
MAAQEAPVHIADAAQVKLLEAILTQAVSSTGR